MSATWFGLDLNAPAEDDTEFAVPRQQNNDPGPEGPRNNVAMNVTSDTRATFGSGVPTGDTLPA